MKFANLISQHLLPILLLVGVLAFFTACDPDTEVVSQEDIEIVELDAQVEDVYEDADQVAFEAMEMTDQSVFARSYSASASRTLTAPCVSITNDTANRVVTVDFGTGCLGPDGRTRSGQIVINYTRRLYRPGATRTVSLVNYVVDSVSIAGSKTWTNLMQNFRDTLSFEVTLSGGQVTLANGLSATRSYTRTTTWSRGANPSQDEFWVVGSSQGSRYNGNSFTRTINDTLIYRRPCYRRGVHAPVAGTATITRSNGSNIDLDFGNGNCDELVDVSVNGNTRTIDLSKR